MSDIPPSQSDETSYAMTLANDSYEWYKSRAIRSRRIFKASETAILLISSSIPLSVVFFSKNTTLPAIFGVAVVVLSGLRSIFHWQDNYLRFSAAREAVEAERRRYHTEVEPYDDPTTKDKMLAAEVTRIEQGEMNSWIEVATERPNYGPTPLP
ncbi:MULTISPECIES: DUF4231 domain-containing protein [Streptomyces]|uniref:DUF4231 domain-containing protein n=1 Tax=Streptomyces clavifer TaxID=68188 RepID=A0ABS4V8E2_9ACTN|nr:MULTISPECIES: DUF4231 domain-containing protein [Streptomyces]MBP2359964.1 hypothetical protein [Streptomyces clavifer]MDX2747844.1 DUF4231 domain-containing protein [Streptomyces sp. NRRL_B-2557]GHB15761.1 hypothetical protein GCM10010392_49880 [Streptomyces clavifer]